MILCVNNGSSAEIDAYFKLQKGSEHTRKIATAAIMCVFTPKQTWLQFLRLKFVP